MDLDRESRAALEFDALLEVVGGHAVTPLGAKRLRALAPLRDSADLGAELARLAETCQHLATSGRIIAGEVADPTDTIASLGVEGVRIEARPLRELAAALAMAAEVARSLGRLEEEEFPRLRELGRGIPDLDAVTRPVLRHVDPEGAIADEASPDLRAIRADIQRVSGRLRRALEKRLHDPDSASLIRDDFITERNGRFVIPVRTDAPRPVQGIVHASSSSGATVFIEPLETVGLNNELVELREEEQKEQDRLLRDWSARFGGLREEIGRAVEAMADLDGLQARALYAERVGAIVPEIADGQGLILLAVRHPLLDLRLRATGGRCVPLDLKLGPEDRVLVLSGPNTGGKTVALKTLGLAVLMAQSGLPVAAETARVPMFRQLRADIGDHQSIQADLSTFSAHLQAVVRFLQELREPALVLFDEIGTGTEPAEGAALARALLERLNREGVTTAATTHQGALKAWAFTTPGAVSAAMEFDTEHLAPTYRVLMGMAGVSAGLDIAVKLGLDREVVDRARGYIGGDAEQTQAYLVRLRELTQELEQRRDDLEGQRRSLAEEHARLLEAAEREGRSRAQDAERSLERALAEFRQRADRELSAIRDEVQRGRLERRRRKAEERLEAAGAAHARRLGVAPVETAPPLEEEPRPGMRVRVQSLGREGEVARVLGQRVEVLLGRMTFTVDRSDLRRAVAAGPSRPARVEAHGPAVRRSGEAGTSTELMLVGRTVDEALPALDKWLDAAALAGHGEVRVVHGHGTGRLRAAVRRFLDGHPLVAGHRPGREGEGGDGATVVILN